MPRRPNTTPPKLRHHKGACQGVVTLNGREVYLGVWPEDQNDPPANVREAYDKEIAQWLQRGRQPAIRPELPSPGKDDAGPVGLTVAEWALRYLKHARGYYVDADGAPTSEYPEFYLSLRPLIHLYGRTSVAELSPLKVKAVRELMVRGYIHPEHGEQTALCRKTVNHRVARIKRAIKWAVSEELCPPSVLHGLQSVAGLQPGRTLARETEDVRPVRRDVLQATLPHLPPYVAGMVRFQVFTGCRPGEAIRLSLGEIDRTDPTLWVYRPARHKTAYRGRPRTIYIGPQAQELVRQFIAVRCSVCGVEGRPERIGEKDNLCATCYRDMDRLDRCGPWQRIEVQDLNEPLFSPARQRDEMFEDKRRKRKSRVQPSQANRKRQRPQVRPGLRYTPHAYTRAINRACKVAGLTPWKPNMLRHLAATEVRKRYGLEATQHVLGHSRADVTQVYAEGDAELARRVAREIG